MEIRAVQQSDNLKLANLIRQVFEEYDAPRQNTVYSDATTDQLYQTIDNPKAALFVALHQNEIVGCCGIYPTQGLPNHCAELVKFYLSAKARGLGIGKALMEKSIAQAKQLGYQQIYLESFPQFEKAVNIYLKQGFTKLNKPMGNSGHLACSIWMSKEI